MVRDFSSWGFGDHSSKSALEIMLTVSKDSQKIQYLAGWSSGDVEVCWPLCTQIRSHHLTHRCLSDDVPSCSISGCILLWVVFGGVCRGSGCDCPQAGCEPQTVGKMIPLHSHVAAAVVLTRWLTRCGHVPPQLWRFCFSFLCDALFRSWCD